ncbi:MAG TPA: DUF4331 family protein [Gemmatimonadaceae bacterium]|jgi:hypothetical protein|nr:DUF4331 family protein [Gemmatimonadaceae bacterium]
MTWRHNTRAALAGMALAFAAAACSSGAADQQLTSPALASAEKGRETADAARVYDQTDFLGNPLVSEVTILKAHHEAYNLTQPYNTATFRPETEGFVTSFNRPQALASLLGSVLYPDVLVVDATKPRSTAGWLSWALSNGWGGRKLTDDVVDLGLSAIFSSFLNPTNAYCAPGALPLCTDNVGANDVAFSATFPYLASPH